jgi:hypothetical protein
MPVAYIYIRGSYFLIKQKINKSKKNYIKFAMPVAKHTAEYASKFCLEGISLRASTGTSMSFAV